MNLKNLSDKFLRLGNVVYWIFIGLSIFVGIGVFLEYIGYEDALVSYTEPLPYLFMGLSLVGSFIVIEGVRRVLRYVSSGASLFQKSLPYGTKYYMYLILLPFLVSILFYFTHPQIRKSYYHSQALIEAHVFENFLSNYGEKLKSGRECYNKAREDSYQSLKSSCDARYRAVKLSYDACREYGSRTMCLSYDDYESIDCSKDALVDDSSYVSSTCDFNSIDAEKAITDYLLFRDNLTLEEKVGIYKKLTSTIEENRDSKLVSVTTSNIEKGNFKEELEYIKNH